MKKSNNESRDGDVTPASEQTKR